MAVKNNKNGNKNIIIVVIVCILLLATGVGIGFKISSIKNKPSDLKDNDFNINDYIEVGDYKSMKVSIAVTRDDIDAEIDDLRDQNTTYVKLDGNVKNGDMIYADIVGYVDGLRADDTCTRDYVEIGSGDWLEGFEEALIGAKTGETKEFTIAIPMGTFGNKDIDGHNVQYKVKVEYICGDEIVPEYNDEFVQSISDYKTVKEYEKHLKKELLKENEEDKAEYAWEELLDICKVKQYPKDMMESAKDIVLQGYYGMSELYGFTKDEIFQSFGYDSEEDFINTDLDELARDTVKENLVAMALSELESISYTEEDYNAVVDEEYSYNTEEYASREDYEKKNEKELKDETLIQAVKKWLAENISFVTK